MSSTTSKSSEPRAAGVGMAQAKHPDDLGRCTACREVYEERLLQGGKCCLCQKPAPVQTAAQQDEWTWESCMVCGQTTDPEHMEEGSCSKCRCSPMVVVPPTAEESQEAALNDVRRCALALRQALLMLPAGTPELEVLSLYAKAIHHRAERLAGQGDSPAMRAEQDYHVARMMARWDAGESVFTPEPAPVQVVQPTDYSGMNRSMLESLCQRHGIRYPLGASRAKLASLLGAASRSA